MKQKLLCEQCLHFEDCEKIIKHRTNKHFTLVDEATKWGEKSKRIKGRTDAARSSSVDNYKTFLKVFPKWYNLAMKCFSFAGIDKKNDDYDKKQKLEKKKKNLPFQIENVLVLLGLLKESGDRLYTLTVSNMMLEFVEEAKNLFCEIDWFPSNIQSNLRNCYSAYALLNDFLLFSQYYPCANLKKEDTDCLDILRRNIKKQDLCHQLDGMTDLLVEVGEKKFFKMAIEGSYFFDKELICKVEPTEKQIEGQTYKIWQARNTTNDEIKKGPVLQEEQEVKYNNGKTKVKTINYYKYIFDDKEFYVEIDPNGNRYVCDLINGSTDLNLGSGKNTIIQNTIISHVWGRAYDPRYFKSLWNIALVPAWANSLMDKENCEKNTLASKMRATVMAICKYRYSEETKNEEVVNKSDIQKGGYLINVIKKPDEETGAIRIVKEKVTLK